MSTLFGTKRMKINEITPDKSKFLQILGNIDNPPTKLYYMGQLPNDRPKTVAIVGTRRPTAYGREVTSRFASELAKRGIVIVSGLALGVDAIAHQACVNAGGRTIAIIPSGLPNIQPSSNHRLAEEIIKTGGAVMSEHLASEVLAIMKWTFLVRNRLVAGLADAVLITEAGSHSGTLNTAAHALNDGRDVLVVPGNITSPMSGGTNRLIRQGATPITSIDDVMAVLYPDIKTSQRPLPLGTNPTEQAIIDALSAGIRDGDEIQRLTKVDPVAMSTAITMLELNEIIRPLGANQWTLS